MVSPWHKNLVGEKVSTYLVLYRFFVLYGLVLCELSDSALSDDSSVVFDNLCVVSNFVLRFYCYLNGRAKELVICHECNFRFAITRTKMRAQTAESESSFYIYPQRFL